MTKFKISGNKLRIASNDACTSIDLDDFSALTIKTKQKSIIFTEYNEAVVEVNCESAVEAKAVYEKLSSKIMKKNKKFRASVFLSKVVLGVFLFYVVLTMLLTSAERKRAELYKEARQQYEQQVQMQPKGGVQMRDMRKASGQGVAVGEMFVIE